MSAPNQPRMDKKNALLKAESWCAYQERAHVDVRNKLFEWGVYPNEVDQIISALIGDNFLNEERFAFAYVSGKFKIKKWGKVKIKYGLKLKKITPKLIQKALNSIDDEEYMIVLQREVEKKTSTIRESDVIKRKFKIAAFLVGRGFERDLIFDVLNANNL